MTALATIREPLLPALTEAMHLLRAVARGQEALFQMVSDCAVDLALHDVGDLRRMHELMTKYSDLPMDFADAALVTGAERDGLNRIFRFDLQRMRPITGMHTNRSWMRPRRAAEVIRRRSARAVA